ncbi:ABC transporter ATP-binding protein [Streptomyces drozdowiczii]|uniref:ATP-binding cassette domain-containing protein n=1 Tax=Streptomyces drozdowiczii TaxID=202862 RepID=A0ABY6PL90_9ACTN|nr:ATP-binding cassette domain-containing protein [Streptomyces drozdowiczii]MCX0247888.1 ATP-binding cassette domain-containing protein [Streptomyces drozdowiczii]UZK52754.1 ATP-binding cassette domain-containing protein [Streptomyces drozdowiczii]
MSSSVSSPSVSGAGQPPMMRLASDRHFEASANLSTWAIARRLPRTLAEAARLGWHTDHRAVLALLACQIGSAALTATALAATTRVLAAVFTGGDILSSLRDNLTAVVVIAVATSGRYLLDAVARAAAARLAPKAVREADLQVITAATAAELVAYEDPDFEDAHAAGSDGAEKTGDLILDAQLLTSAAAQMAAAATVVTVLHPVMLPLLVLSVVPCAWGAVRGARIEHAAHHRNLADCRLRNVFRSYTTERNTADEVRAGTMAGFLIRQYRIVSGRLEAEQLKATRQALVVQGVGDALTAVGTVVTWAVLVLLVASGRMELAVAGTAALAVRTSGAALATTVRAGARLFRTSLSLDDWARFLAVAKPWTTRRGTATVAEDGPQVITAEGVSFTYPGANAPALDGIDLDLKRGEVIALVGENGAGKSTLARLLTGLFLPTSGSVRWDGVDLADADPAKVLAQVALVPQDYTRWPLAARENITLGQRRPEGDTAVHAAAEAAGADSVIAALPHGLDTSLARSWWGGHDLSGGQWQRVAVARAFHRDAPVLVMDEPTAALDARAEHRIYTRLKALAAGRATVFITHRLANTRLADRIIVLDHGRISETGTYDELIDQAGDFFEMLKLQEDRC